MLSASIVLFKNDRQILLKAINSFLNCKLSQKLYLIDNSPTDDLKNICSDSKIEYVFNPSNPGFGAAHNIALKKAIENKYSYHLILNPDVFFESDILIHMYNYLNENFKVGMIMPQVLNNNGSIQYLPKLLPSPLSIVIRKFKIPHSFHEKYINKYELRFVDKTLIYNSPLLSGCFSLLRIESVKEVGMYDDKYFMYFEDWDLSRRMHQKFKTIYYPSVSIYHDYESGANKNMHLFIIFLKSAFYYFNKWGWFYDKQRILINKKALSQFK